MLNYLLFKTYSIKRDYIIIIISKLFAVVSNESNIIIDHRGGNRVAITHLSRTNGSIPPSTCMMTRLLLVASSYPPSIIRIIRNVVVT